MNLVKKKKAEGIDLIRNRFPSFDLSHGDNKLIQRGTKRKHEEEESSSEESDSDE